jgi:hypothetical protein
MSLMLVVPFWKEKNWWQLLRRFRVIDILPTGSHLFIAPRWECGDETFMFKGPTQWPTLVLYLGPEYHPERLWRATMRFRSSIAEYQRLTTVQRRNMVLSGDREVDGSAILNLLNRIAPILGRYGPFMRGIEF